ERPGAPESRLHLVEAEQRAEVVRELGSRGDELLLERDHSTLAEHRLEEDQPYVLGRAFVQRLDVVRRGELNAGQQWLEGSALRRLSRGGERAGRPAVEAAFQRDHAVLAGCLARVLQRGLVRLGPGVAEERLGAAEPFGEHSRECRSRLRGEKVRGMPEPLELSVRGGERRRMPVTERDDGDPGAEVEIRPAGVVEQPDAVAGDEGHVRLGVDRKQRALYDGAHATTAVAPICAARPPRAALAAARSLGTIPP